ANTFDFCLLTFDLPFAPGHLDRGPNERGLRSGKSKGKSQKAKGKSSFGSGGVRIGQGGSYRSGKSDGAERTRGGRRQGKSQKAKGKSQKCLRYVHFNRGPNEWGLRSGGKKGFERLR